MKSLWWAILCIISTFPSGFTLHVRIMIMLKWITILWFYSLSKENGRKWNILLQEIAFFHKSLQVLLPSNVDKFFRNTVYLHLNTVNAQEMLGLFFQSQETVISHVTNACNTASLTLHSVWFRLSQELCVRFYTLSQD